MLTKQHGFTLLEMMLAIALFALVSAMAFFLMQGVIRNSEITQQRSISFSEIQRTLMLLEQDVTQAIIRPPIPGSNNPVPEFTYRQQSQDITLALLRGNWLNPGGYLPRSTLQRIVWRWHHARLERLSFTDADSMSEQPAQSDVQLEEVSYFQLRFWRNSHWETRWAGGYSLPQAIEVTLDVTGYGRFQRILMIREPES